VNQQPNQPDFSAALAAIATAAETLARGLTEALAPVAAAVEQFVKLVRENPELLAALQREQPQPHVTLAELRAALGGDGASLPAVRFNAEGGFHTLN
jgi:hypothetical protein